MILRTFTVVLRLKLGPSSMARKSDLTLGSATDATVIARGAA